MRRSGHGLVIAAILPVAVASLSGCGSGCSLPVYNLEMPPGSGLRQGAEVQIAGRRVGTVCSVGPGRIGGVQLKNRAELSLPGNRLGEATSAVVYPSLVELSPGSPAAPPIPSGGVIPISHVVVRTRR